MKSVLAFFVYCVQLPAGLGVAFDARGLTEINDIKREVLGNFATSMPWTDTEK